MPVNMLCTSVILELIDVDTEVRTVVKVTALVIWMEVKLRLMVLVVANLVAK